MAERKIIPAYMGFSAFANFINSLRETKLPSKIDKSVLPKASGGQFSATRMTLRFLGLVDDNDKPTVKMQQLVAATDEARKPLYDVMLREGYAFLFADPEFDLETTTGIVVASKIREQDVSGSTVSKCVAFFIALAQAAGLQVSPHLKPPSVPRNGGKKARPKRESAVIEPDDAFDGDEDEQDLERFEIPIPGKKSVRVIVPSDLDADDWTMLQSMITVYINRWKGFKAESKKGEATDG